MEGLTEEEVKLLISTSNEFAVNCLRELYKKQTDAEQRAKTTAVYNDVGFNKNDSGILSSFAEQVRVWDNEEQHKFKSPLSPKQLVVLRNRLPKYSRQLSDLLK